MRSNFRRACAAAVLTAAAPLFAVPGPAIAEVRPISLITERWQDMPASQLFGKAVTNRGNDVLDRHGGELGEVEDIAVNRPRCAAAACRPFEAVKRTLFVLGCAVARAGTRGSTPPRSAPTR